MKHRTLMLLTTAALTLSLLAACGPKDDGGNSGSQSGSTPSASQSAPSGSGSSDAGAPDTGVPDVGVPGGESSSAQPDASQPQARLTLNKTDFSLFYAGDHYRLKAADLPQGTEITWTSSDEGVATVSQDGTVTAVSAGSVTITASAGDQSAACKVYCKIEADTPTSGSGSSSAGGSSSSSSASQVDLAAFYTDLTADYQFPSSMRQADSELMAVFFPGLGDIATEQCLAYANQMSMNNGELVLVEVSNSKDVDAVKEILQARVDGMINGGAWYPEPTRIWTECSKVVSNGNYIMMVVNEEYSAIVDDFNALF